MIIRIFFYVVVVVVAVAADRSAVPDRLVLPQRRHLQILRGRRRARLPVSFSLALFRSRDLIQLSKWPRQKKETKTKNLLSEKRRKYRWHFSFDIFSFFSFLCVFLSLRCAEGYKGQRCENKDIYNLGSKSSVWAF
jgi:hypothetical protein